MRGWFHRRTARAPDPGLRSFFKASGVAPRAEFRVDAAAIPVIAWTLGNPSADEEVVMRSPRVARSLDSLRLALAALLVFAPLGAPERGAAAPPTEIKILSSAPHQVSGGDALVRVQFPAPDDLLTKATRRLNGVNVTNQLTLIPAEGAFQGVVSGFLVGANLLQLYPSPKSPSVLAQLAVTNYPQSGPIFSGPQQQPF